MSTNTTSPPEPAAHALERARLDASRRGFLRDLTALPLAGDVVTLVGNPTGVAEPASPQLLGCYLEWLRLEREAVQDLLLPGSDPYAVVSMLPGAGAALSFHAGQDGDEGAGPASRAAFVLSAVGCDWTGRRSA